MALLFHVLISPLLLGCMVPCYFALYVFKLVQNGVLIYGKMLILSGIYNHFMSSISVPLYFLLLKFVKVCLIRCSRHESERVSSCLVISSLKYTRVATLVNEHKVFVLKYEIICVSAFV